MGGIEPWNAALSTLLAAVAVVLGTYRVALRLFDAWVAFAAGLIVLTTYGVFALARAPMPDMLLCAAFTAAMAAYAAAEFGGHRLAMIVFYVLVGVAFWSKGPAGLIPLVVAVVDEVATRGWSGLARLMPVRGLVLLGLLTIPWWLLAETAGRERFVQEVLVTDFISWYVPSHGWSWQRLIKPVNQVFTIALPWSLLLPTAAWWTRRAPVDREQARRIRWLMAWFTVVFVVIAISDQQRMRYYLPLCPAAAILVARWLGEVRLPHRDAVLAGTWAIVALGLVVFQVQADARHNASTDIRAIADEVRNAPMPLYAFECPELVFAFYLQRSVTTLPSYDHFVRDIENGYLIIQDRALPSPGTAPPVRQAAAAVVEGRRYLMLAKGFPTSAGVVGPY